jgi:dTDP-4-dehydrorhamnose 3,5-epimerase
MIFEDTRIGGVWIIRPERLEDDDRGFFAQTWDEEFAERGLARAWSSAGSFHRRRGTLCGLQHQAAPHEESKQHGRRDLRRRGRLRPELADLPRLGPAELSSENRVALYIPEACGDGLLTLDGSEVFYQMTEA